MNRMVAATTLFLLAACGSGEQEPVEIDTRHDACAWCRMTVSDARFAAQVVAPGEEPLLFDDLGCLRDWLEEGARIPDGAVAWVADHRTREWARAVDAAYTHVPGLHTPMASGLVAHASAESRAADPEAVGGDPLTALDVFGAVQPPGGKP